MSPHFAPYRCPADVFLSAQQIKAGFPYRVRSVSMNCFWGRYSRSNDSTMAGRNTFFPQFRQFLKLADCPSPERTWVFLDEHPDSINDGYFLNQPNIPNWQDIPASYHDGGGHCLRGRPCRPAGPAGESRGTSNSPAWAAMRVSGL